MAFILNSFAGVRFVAGSRGDDQSANESMQLQTLPHATFQFEGQRIRQIQKHVTPGSFLDESAGKLTAHDHSDTEAKADSHAPTGSTPGSVVISISQIPMANFVGANPDQQDQHTTSITVKHDTAESGTKRTVVLNGRDQPSVHVKIPKNFEEKFDAMPLSVVRIQAITAEVNWFEPYQQPQDMQLVGSGLAVEIEGVPNLDKDPIFITNAHVVRDAHDVQVQLPAIGQQSFEAFVPVICDDFDLAVVQLVEPTKFL
jgi:hypothetical protein